LAFGALLLAPFLDNGPGRRPHRRPIAVTMMLLGLASVIWLTYESAAAVDWEQRAEENKPIPESDIEIDEEDPGFAIFENNCMSCHGEFISVVSSCSSLIVADYTPEEFAHIALNLIGIIPPDSF